MSKAEKVPEDVKRFFNPLLLLALSKLRQVEGVVHWSRDRWHVKIADYLNQVDSVGKH